MKVEPPTTIEAPSAWPRESDVMLLEFLRERDVACPRCGYSLRNLSRPVCPECEEPLQLQVGVQKIRVLWLFIALAPGAFCAIALGILGVMVGVMALVYGELPSERPPLNIILTLGFFVASALHTILLARAHRRFLQLSIRAQLTWALATWAAHILAFITFVLTAN